MKMTKELAEELCSIDNIIERKRVMIKYYALNPISENSPSTEYIERGRQLMQALTDMNNCMDDKISLLKAVLEYNGELDKDEYANIERSILKAKVILQALVENLPKDPRNYSKHIDTMVNALTTIFDLSSNFANTLLSKFE